MTTPQQLADRMLIQWQIQRAQRIPPEQRKLDDQYESDLAVLRQVIGRK